MSDHYTVTRDKPKASPAGTKADAGKPRMELLDPYWLTGTARVLTFGAQKYSAHNWRGGIEYSRLIGAMMRHTAAISRGEDIDPESGELHAYHISCCAMMLAVYTEEKRTALDDRVVAAVPKP